MGLAVNAGISYYGLYRETLLPYAAALLGAAYFALRAIDALPPDEKILRLALKTYALLIVGLVITPYTVSTWLNYLHIVCGTALFSLQLLLSCWVAWKLRYIWWSIGLLLVELASGIAAAHYLNLTHGFLLQSQLTFQMAFGALLVLSLPALVLDIETPIVSGET